jgi:hypothetical protein
LHIFLRILEEREFAVFAEALRRHGVTEKR